VSNASDSGPISVLFLGASFGAVLGMRIAAAGHKVTFVCRQDEADLINARKLFLRVPTKQGAAPLEIGAQHCKVMPDACVPGDADPRAYDLVCLAMQEPQYSFPEVRQLIERIATARVPCLSIMNMPVPPFLQRITALDDQVAESVFTDAELWARMDRSVFTMAGADPQAKRTEDSDALIIAVTLPTNFKVAPFENESAQSVIQRLAEDIDSTRIDVEGISYHPCVRLRPHTSNFIPLAKWPMLVTGNFRCITSGPPVSIRDAVCSNESESRELYDWVVQVCLALGTEQSILVPFDAYRRAAEGLSLPSSLARGLYAGATAVERIDVLIQALASQHGMSHPALDRIVGDVSGRLEKNGVMLN